MSSAVSLKESALGSSRSTLGTREEREATRFQDVWPRNASRYGAAVGSPRDHEGPHRRLLDGRIPYLSPADSSTGSFPHRDTRRGIRHTPVDDRVGGASRTGSIGTCTRVHQSPAYAAIAAAEYPDANRGAASGATEIVTRPELVANLRQFISTHRSAGTR